MKLDEPGFEAKTDPLEDLGTVACRDDTLKLISEQKFKRLAADWKSRRGPVSSPTKLVMHPAYQSIIGMGPVAIPFLLQALEQEPDLWFWALRAITETDPVPAKSRGRVKEMAEAWLAWGREQEYRW